MTKKTCLTSRSCYVHTGNKNHCNSTLLMIMTDNVYASGNHSDKVLKY